MPATPIHSSRLSTEPPKEYAPLLPTVVVASYKGGVGKTSLTVPISERLAWAGLRVLLLTCDTQEDARHRLGVQASEPSIARRAYGQNGSVNGSVTVAGIRGAKAVDLLYRLGPEKLGVGSFDIAVLDTPAEVQGGSLPGVLLIATIDGGDAARNLIQVLERTPTNTQIVLVRFGREDLDEWAQNAEEITKVLGRPMEFLAEPLPMSKLVKKAHGQGQSVWTLRRTGPTSEFLSGVETLTQMAWKRITPKREWPPAPRPSVAGPYVAGWDDDDEA